MAGGRGSLRKFLLIWGNKDECMNETLTLGMERCVCVRDGNIKEFILNKIQWEGEEQHQQCPLGLALVTGGVWMLFVGSGGYRR